MEPVSMPFLEAGMWGACGANRSGQRERIAVPQSLWSSEPLRCRRARGCALEFQKECSVLKFGQLLYFRTPRRQRPSRVALLAEQ